jgi:hypothetical protein
MLLLLVAGCKEPEPRMWVRYTAPDSSFSIDIPKGYKVFNDKKSKTAFAKRPKFTLYWRIDTSDIAGMDIKSLECSYIDIPDGTKWFSPKQLLDHSINDFINRQYAIPAYGRVLTHVSSTIDTFQGQKLVAIVDVNKGDSLIVFLRQYLVGDRMYSLIVNGYKSYTDVVEVDRFLSSFKPRRSISTKHR